MSLWRFFVRKENLRQGKKPRKERKKKTVYGSKAPKDPRFGCHPLGRREG